MVDQSMFLEDVQNMTPLEVIRKYITFGSTHVFEQNEYLYYQLKQAVSSRWNLHPSNVMVVGSGKLGFSIAPSKFMREFGDTSDLDVAIVSAELFDEYWKLLYRYDLQGAPWHRKQDFTKFLFQGWIRPDKFPFRGYVKEADQWWDFFVSLTGSRKFGPYKISGGIYRDFFFLESYQLQCIERQKRLMEVGKSVRQH